MFIDSPQENFKTKSYGEISQRKYYYALKMKEMTSIILKSKAKVYVIPFIFKIEIDAEKLKGMTENEQRFYSDVCSGEFVPKFMQSTEREK